MSTCTALRYAPLICIEVYDYMYPTHLFPHAKKIATSEHSSSIKPRRRYSPMRIVQRLSDHCDRFCKIWSLRKKRKLLSSTMAFRDSAIPSNLNKITSYHHFYIQMRGNYHKMHTKNVLLYSDRN